jgi:hypothetical protein
MGSTTTTARTRSGTRAGGAPSPRSVCPNARVGPTQQASEQHCPELAMQVAERRLETAEQPAATPGRDEPRGGLTIETAGRIEPRGGVLATHVPSAD